MTKKIQNFSFLVFSSIIFIWSYFIPSFLEDYGKESWIYILICLVASIIVIILSKMQTPNNAFSKIVESLYLFFSLIFIIYLSTNVLSNYFLLSKGFIASLVPLVVAIILLEFFGRETIFDTSTIFFLVGLILLFLPFFTDVANKKFELILPLEMNGNFFKLFLALFIPLDLMHLYHLEITKKEILISNIFLFVLCALYIVNLVSVYGEIYLTKLGFPGFALYESKGASSVFAQIDFLFLYLIPISVIFTSALRLNIIRENMRINKSKVASFILGILLIIITLIVNKRGINLFYPLCVILIILFLWRVYGLFKGNKKAV